MASHHGHTEIVQILLSNGASIEAKTTVSITVITHNSIMNVTVNNNLYNNYIILLLSNIF